MSPSINISNDGIEIETDWSGTNSEFSTNSNSSEELPSFDELLSGSHPGSSKTTLNKTRKLTDTMGTHNANSWFIEEAFDRYGVNKVMQIMHDGGVSGVAEEVLHDISESISDLEEDSSSYIRAFNDATLEMPHIVRAYVASFEADHRDETDESATYIDKCNNFAESMGVGDREMPQATLTLFNEDYDWLMEQSEAYKKASCYLAADGEDYHVLDDYSDMEIRSFINSFRENGDIKFAIRASSFADDIPKTVIKSAAHPRDWEELNPGDVSITTCGSCEHHFYEIEDEPGNVTHVNTTGESVRIRESGNDLRFFEMTRPPLTEFDHVCADCVSIVFDQNLPDQVVIFDEDGRYECIHDGGIIIQDATDRSLAEIPDELFDMVFAPRNDDLITIEADESIGISEQNLRYIVDSFGSVPGFAVATMRQRGFADNYAINIRIPTYCLDTVRQIKQEAGAAVENENTATVNRQYV